MHENGKMRPLTTVPGMEVAEKRRMMEGVKSSMVYFKNFVNVTAYPKYNNNKIVLKINLLISNIIFTHQY
jgi:hypothetical protein